MNWPSVKRVFPQVLVWTAVAALSGAMVLAQDMSAATASSQEAAARSDSQIEMDVVHALDASQALKNDLITAATIQAEVTLSGTVSSESSRKLAASLAGQVQGVTKVHNNLLVGNPQQAANASDQQGADKQAEENAVQPAPEAVQPAPENEPSASGYPQQAQPGYPEAQQPQEAYPPPPPPQPQYAPDQPDQAQPGYPEAQEPQGAYPPPSPGQPQYVPARPQPPVYERAEGPVTVPPGTLLLLRTSEPVSTKMAKQGTPVQFLVIQDVAVGGVLAIPRGATVHGVVTEAKKAGALGGSPELAIQLTSLDLGGVSYPLASNEFKVKGPNKAGSTVGHAFGGAILGALIGGAMDRGFGAAVGAGAGAAAGTAASAATPGPGIWIPAEARVDFQLQAPLTVTPVSPREAARLAEGLYQGGPVLYRRGYYPYGYPHPPYPYGYPPGYYRPY
jgi:hypothetical protein